MMNAATAAAKHEELLTAARANGPVAQAVVELHAPERGWNGFYADCTGCVGSIQGDSPSWPDDCTTTEIVARALGVEL